MSLIEEGFSLPLIIFSWGWFHLFYFYSNGYCLLVCQHINLFSAAFVFGEKRGKPFSFLCHEHIHSPPHSLSLSLSFSLSSAWSLSLSLSLSFSLDNTTLPCQVVRKVAVNMAPCTWSREKSRQGVWQWLCVGLHCYMGTILSCFPSLGILFHQLHLIMNARLFKVSEEFSWDENLLFGRLITYVLCRL